MLVASPRSTPKHVESEQLPPHQHPQGGHDAEPIDAVGLQVRTHSHNNADVNGHSLGSFQKTVRSGDHNQGIDTVLRGNFDQQPPHRVQKTQKKKLPTSSQRPKAAAFLQQFASSTNDVDQALQTLRAALFAEQDRKEQEAATHIKHEKEVKGLLQDQVKQLSASAADWKDKYDSLHVNVTQLREKAKTNQKYVVGLQKDHEKLKKSTTILQEDCKKALQQKILEVEHEKEVLRQELEKTLNVVGKGQERLRKMVDELYVQLVISQSKGRDLAENLTKQTAMYEAEKAKRNDLENRLLSSVQGVQRQLGDHTTNMAEKIGALQGSVDGIDAKVKQESGVEKCLEALQKLQETPFLTIKDVRKAEGMLRFIHKG
jgi:chromosome segregation ATPase